MNRFDSCKKILEQCKLEVLTCLIFRTFFQRISNLIQLKTSETHAGSWNLPNWLGVQKMSGYSQLWSVKVHVG